MNLTKKLSLDYITTEREFGDSDSCPEIGTSCTFKLLLRLVQMYFFLVIAALLITKNSRRMKSLVCYIHTPLDKFKNFAQVFHYEFCFHAIFEGRIQIF